MPPNPYHGMSTKAEADAYDRRMRPLLNQAERKRHREWRKQHEARLGGVQLGLSLDEDELRATEFSAATLASITARASGPAILLCFTAALHAKNARVTGHYTVLVDGARAAVQSVGYAGQIVTLRLRAGAFREGDSLTVSWSGLRDAEGRLLRPGGDVVDAG